MRREFDARSRFQPKIDWFEEFRDETAEVTEVAEGAERLVVIDLPPRDDWFDEFADEGTRPALLSEAAPVMWPDVPNEEPAIRASAGGADPPAWSDSAAWSVSWAADPDWRTRLSRYTLPMAAVVALVALSIAMLAVRFGLTTAAPDSVMRADFATPAAPPTAEGGGPLFSGSVSRGSDAVATASIPVPRPSVSPVPLASARNAQPDPARELPLSVREPIAAPMRTPPPTPTLTASPTPTPTPAPTPAAAVPPPAPTPLPIAGGAAAAGDQNLRTAPPPVGRQNLALAPPPAAKPTPAPTPAAPAEDPVAAHRAAISTVLDQYRNAYASLDAAAVRRVWPTVNARSLERAFGQLAEQRFDFHSCGINVTGQFAEAACTGQAAYVPKVGSRTARVESRQWTFHLRRLREGWIIDRVVAR
jgi:hypothetical protein